MLSQPHPALQPVRSADTARRALGAVVGALMGLGYAWVASSINVWLLPLPIKFEITAMLNEMLAYGAGGAVVGAVTAWPGSTWRGIVLGAAATVLLSMGLESLQAVFAGAQGVATLVILVAFFFPAVVFSSPISVALRFVVNRLSEAFLHTAQVRWQPLALGLVTLVTLVGLAGSFRQYSPPEREMLTRVNNVVQFALNNPDQPAGLPLRSILNLRRRLTPEYTLSARAFTSEAGGGFAAQSYVEVRVEFASGLRLLCVGGESLGDVVCTEPLPGRYGP